MRFWEEAQHLLWWKPSNPIACLVVSGRFQILIALTCCCARHVLLLGLIFFRIWLGQVQICSSLRCVRIFFVARLFCLIIGELFVFIFFTQKRKLE